MINGVGVPKVGMTTLNGGIWNELVIDPYHSIRPIVSAAMGFFLAVLTVAAPLFVLFDKPQTDVQISKRMAFYLERAQ